MLSLDAALEALLFFKAEPVKIKRLSQILRRPEAEILGALDQLAERLKDRGVKLLRNNDEAALGTVPDAARLIEQLTKEELAQELGQAALQTLTIIMYKSPVPKSEIDYIRGVNSGFIIRHLMIRGLIERTVNPRDARSFLYRPTMELLNHLGIAKIEELPEYGSLTEKINQLKP